MKQEKDNRKNNLVLPPSGLAKDILNNMSPTGEGSASRPNPGGGDPGNDTKDSPFPEPDETQKKYVTFHLEHEEYGLPISHVREINRVGEITRVPNSSDYLMGVINLRGRIVPVMELRRRLCLPPAQIDKESRIVIAENGPKLFGLLVDQVSEVRAIIPDQIEDPPDEVKANGNLISGVAKLDERRLVILLDPELIWTAPAPREGEENSPEFPFPEL